MDPRQLRSDFEKVAPILEAYGDVDPRLEVPLQEYRRRQEAVRAALEEAGVPVAVVFSDEHYDGDVPYLGGNANITIEQVAGAIGAGEGMHIVAGLEGGYVAEQLAPRAGAKVHKVEFLKLADEEYPIEAEALEDVLAEAAGRRRVDRIGLLSPRQVIPASLVAYLEGVVGRDNVVDLQETYQRIKYEKSEIEMALIRQASRIAEAMMRAMLAVLEPGKRETEVAAWAYWAGRLLGAEETGFDVMVGSDTANRTLIGKALNRPIREGAFVHLGVSPKRDGLASCIRRSVVAVRDPADRTASQRFWMDFIVGAYRLAHATYVEVARAGKPAYLVEKALVDHFAARSQAVSRRIGRPVDLVRQKPYTGTHNAGYTECQEFYGAITLQSREPLGRRIVTMLDVAVRGVGSHWDEVVIPELDFVVVENTLGKFGARVECFHELPEDPQASVGRPGGL